jgi:photoactive yellow protein
VEERIALLNEILDALPVGVVVLDPAGTVVHFNRAEERLAKRQRERALGRDFFQEIAPCMDVRELGGVFRDSIGRRPIDARLELRFAFPYFDRPRDVVVHMKSVDVRGAPFAALIIEDVSEQRATARMQQVVSDLLAQDARSPVAHILASCGFLVHRTPRLEPRAVATVAEIAQNADHLQAMLLNLLDIGRLESGTAPVTLRAAPLWPLVSEIVSANRAYAARKGVVLDAESAAPGRPAAFDAPLLRRSLDTLIQNAIRHTPPGGRVSLWHGEVEGEQTLIEVGDEGPPIDRELEDLIFEKYLRVQDEDQRSDNRGLALTFARMVARAHGGEVTLRSTEGAGTFARLVLPGLARPPFMDG